MKTRECSNCGKSKPLTSDYFPVHDGPNGSKDGFRPQCLTCFNDKRRSKYAEPKPKRVEEKLDVIVEHHLKGRVRELEQQNKTLIADLANEKQWHAYADEAMQLKLPGIRPRERKSKVREATALACASDWHIEELVDPAKVEHRNRYNLEISKRRMQRFFEAVTYSINFNRQIFKVRDLMLWLGGDIITNYLHEDNNESNLLSPVQAISYAQASIGDGIRFLLKDPELEHISIPCNDGNHGRLTKRMRSNTRVENSMEWLLYTNLAREFAHEKRVKFEIAVGSHLYVDCYGRTIRFLHGDQVKYAGGVGGVTIPVNKAIAQWDRYKPADLTVMGHWHQLFQLSNLIINGSLIGYSPYSIDIKAGFEPPAQAFTMLDPLRFKSVSMPLWVSDRSDDINTRDTYEHQGRVSNPRAQRERSRQRAASR